MSARIFLIIDHLIASLPVRVINFLSGRLNLKPDQK